MSTCEICGDILAQSVEGYKNHYKRFHNTNMRVVEKTTVLPLRTTNRSKLQIVHDMEKVWGRAIIPSVAPWHSLGDRI